ncbi:MAG TPA: hypothetical protein VIL48_06275 [Acidimicrobiales bacterium]
MGAFGSAGPADRAAYADRARAAVRALVEDGFLLERDVGRTVAAALRAYDAR